MHYVVVVIVGHVAVLSSFNNFECGFTFLLQSCLFWFVKLWTRKSDIESHQIIWNTIFHRLFGLKLVEK